MDLLDVLNASAVRSTEIDDDMETTMKRAKRKPNFTPPERMHLAKSYVENVEEYNRGFTSATRGDAKHGRQRLLEKWAAELTAFGVVERTTVEVEQKLRDYMKKIIGNNRRPHKRPLSPAAELLSTVLPQCSTTNSDDVNGSDPQTEYADFLLRQHRAASNDSLENSPDSKKSCPVSVLQNQSRNRFEDQTPILKPESYTEADVVTAGPPIDFSLQIDDTVRMQRALLAQQLENARADHTLKRVQIENARIEQKIKLMEFEKKKLELGRLIKETQPQPVINHSNTNGALPNANVKESKQ